MKMVQVGTEYTHSQNVEYFGFCMIMLFTFCQLENVAYKIVD